MVNSMVERATSSMLIGPDWAMNIEICDICNHDPVQAKDVVKGIKKRLGSKNPKVQLFTLTLLETVVKNCGDIVHMHVAEKDVLHEMVKIAKKKPDFHVKEKILILIDTWQEAFGGPRARYPQYFAAYQELLRIGAVFPQRSESAAPVFTPPQTNPLSSYPQNLRNTDSRADDAESSAEAEFPTLSLTEIQNARSIMDVLAEMLYVLDPGTKEDLKQDVIVELVAQCRTYKQRVVHLVNSTSDESLLEQGLTLNDELQRVLAKHEAIASGTTAPAEKPKTEPAARSLVDVDSPLIDTGDSKQSDQGSSSSAALGTQLLLPAPATNGPPSTLANNPKMDLLSGDLLSGDDFSSPKAGNSLALVPVGEPQPASPVSSQQNALALVDMFSQNNAQSPYSVGQTPQYQQQQNLQSPQTSLYQNGGFPGATLPAQYEQSGYAQGSNNAWNGQIPQQQQPSSPAYGAESNNSLPPPPWEAQPADNGQMMASQPPQTMQVGQVVQYPHGSQHGMNEQGVNMYMQPVHGGYPAAVNNQGNQPVGMHPQPIPGGQSMGMYPQPMQSAQMAYMYQQQAYNNQMAGYGYGYGYGQQQNAQLLEQRMSGMSMNDGVQGNSSHSSSSPSYAKPSKPEDKLFGDLVDMNKFKTKTTPGGA